ncbi:MAG: tail fiber domain-containing protein, partial [Bacteroidetes bacterium]|nr:tail fiber domain-containing protein [Bacteroidota bacterium]
TGEVKATKFVDDDASFYADLNTGGNLGGNWGINHLYNNVGLNIRSGLAYILRNEDNSGAEIFSVSSAGAIKANGTITASGEVKATKFVDDVSTYYVDLNTGANVKGDWIWDGGYIKVVGYKGITYGAYGWLNKNGSTGSSSGTYNYSITAEKRISAEEFNAYSDIRIKDVVGKSDNVADLNILKKLSVTDYHFIDQKMKGNGNQKKLIAQEVKAIYPQSVSATTDFVPSVYEDCLAVTFNEKSKQVTITTNKEHGFAEGDKIRLFYEENKEELKTDFEIVSVNDEHSFVIKKESPFEGGVFVYGKEVNDFLSIDYDAIAMLNVSATQKLASDVDILKEQVEMLAKENHELKERNVSLENEYGRIKESVVKFAEMMKRVSELEAKFAKYSNSSDDDSSTIILKTADNGTTAVTETMELN